MCLVFLGVLKGCEGAVQSLVVVPEHDRAHPAHDGHFRHGHPPRPAAVGGSLRGLYAFFAYGKCCTPERAPAGSAVRLFALRSRKCSLLWAGLEQNPGQRGTCPLVTGPVFLLHVLCSFFVFGGCLNQNKLF